MKNIVKLLCLSMLLATVAGLSAKTFPKTVVLEPDLSMMVEGAPNALKFCVPANCLCEIKDEVCEVERILEDVLSVVDAIDLETCPVTLLYNIPGGNVLTDSGRYCLAEDLVATCSVAIVIDGAGITLDLNGHTIFVNTDDCDSEFNAGIFVVSDALANDIVIKNGTITTQYYDNCNTTGIWLDGCEDGGVTNVRIEDVACTNLCTGIYVNCAVGTVIHNAAFHFNFADIYCQDDSATTITNSTFFESDLGLAYCNSHNMIVRDCSFSWLGTAIANGDCGAECYDGVLLDVAEFDNCMVSETEDDGFIFRNASSVVVRNCHASENNCNGFHVICSSDIVFRDCYASENGRECEGRSGFNAYNSSDISFYNCFSQNNGTNGFHAFNDDSGNNLVFRNCTATNNEEFGFKDNNTDNNYYANYACGNDTNYNPEVLASQASTTSPNNQRGVHNVDCLNTAVDQVAAIESIVENISSVVDGVCQCTEMESLFEGLQDQLEVITSVVEFIADFETDDCSVTLISNTDAPQTFSAPGRYCLSNDIHSLVAGSSAITFEGGNSITLDLNGHTVFAPVGDGTAIYVDGLTSGPAHDITIHNGSVDSDEAQNGNGIYADTVSALRIEDVSCTNCNVGISLNNAHNILMNNVISYKHNRSGLELDTVDGLLAQSCLFNHNGQGATAAGVSGDSVSNSEFVNCIANDTVNGSGFSLTGTNLLLRDCFASNNLTNMGNGFSFNVSTNVCLYNCYAESNGSIGNHAGSGFAISTSTHVLVRNCTAINNGGYGFNDDGCGDGNQYYANFACNNNGGSFAPNFSANYNNVCSAPVTSPANARGVHNVDCANNDPDQISAIQSCVCPLAP